MLPDLSFFSLSVPTCGLCMGLGRLLGGALAAKASPQTEYVPVNDRIQ